MCVVCWVSDTAQVQLESERVSPWDKAGGAGKECVGGDAQAHGVLYIRRADGVGQGLTLVHFSAQLERFLWDRGCAYGSCSPRQVGVRGCLKCVGCYFVSDMAQVQLKSE